MQEGLDSAPRAVAVVIISHNYGRFLAEAIESVLAQSCKPAEILVVDAGSLDETRDVAGRFQEWSVAYLRIEAGNVHEARKQGLAATRSEVVCFLDADDRLGVNYLRTGLPLFRDHTIGVVYSDLYCFGTTDKVIRFPESVERSLLAVDNVIHAGSLVRRSALTASSAFEQPLTAELACLTGDWWIWRNVLQQGWRAVKQSGRYEYRRHADSALSQAGSHPNYFDRAWLSREIVTLFIPLSGRGSLWSGLAGFLENQTWPHSQVQLLLLDTSQNAEFEGTVRRWAVSSDYADVRYARHAVGASGLADADRMESVNQVRNSMARIYNWMRRNVTTEYVWILEDDILPPLDVCERLLQGFDAQTASVAAPYRSRFHHGYVVWDAMEQSLDEPGHNRQLVGGNGFGCTLVRSMAIRQQIFTAEGRIPDFDHAFYQRLRSTPYSAKVDWTLECQHLGTNGTRVPAQTARYIVSHDRPAAERCIPEEVS